MNLRFLLLCFLFFSSCDLFDSFRDKTTVPTTTTTQPTVPITSPLLNDTCVWYGFIGPRNFNCDGKAYMYGKISCVNSGVKDLFCSAIHGFNIPACINDSKNPATVACANKHSQQQAQSCQWVRTPKTVECNGKSYVHGSASCASFFHQVVFCSAEHSQNVPQCLSDNSPETLNCLVQSGLKK